MGENPDNTGGALEIEEDWTVGARQGPVRLFKGYMRDVCHWDRALNRWEVEYLYASGSLGGGATPRELLLSADSLKLVLPLDEPAGSSNVVDRTVNSHTGVVYNAVADGEALYFNGTDAVVDMGNPSALNFSGAFSITVWIQPQAWDGNRNIFMHGQTADNGRETGLRIESGRYHFYSYDKNVGENRSKYWMPAEDKTGTAWVHLAGTCDGTNWDLYRNGELLWHNTGSTLGGALTNAENWAVGGRLDGTRLFKGSIRGATLWSRALTATEVHDIYSAGTGNPFELLSPERSIDRTWLAVDFSGNSSLAGPQNITVTNAFVDTDGEGLVNQDEFLIGTDINNTDTDGDQLDDYMEVMELGSDPLSGDTDEDGMPDKWEHDNLTGLLVYSAWDDPDRDGLANFDEWLEGTDPQNPDTDDDGIGDGTEVLTAFTDPHTADFDGTQTQAGSAVAGSTFTASTGSWSIEGGSVNARERSGSLTYTLTTPAPAADALSVTITQWNVYTAQDAFDLSLDVDGLFCGRVIYYAAYGETAQALFFLPVLTPGEHSFRLTWRNNNANTFLQVDSLAFVNLGGPDADSNGFPDWRDSRLENVWQFEQPAEQSYVSPVCIEGAGLFINDVLIYTGNSITQRIDAVSQGVGDRWFYDAVLDPVTNTAVLIDGIEGTSSVSFDVGWSLFDLTAPPTNTYILRTGDALLLGADINTSVTVSNTLSAVTTNWVFNAEAVPFTFEDTGDYLITSVTGGTYVAGLVATLTADSESEHDERLSVSLDEVDGVPVLDLNTQVDKELGIIARLPSGPVVDAARVVPVYADAGDYWRVTRTFPDGTRLVEVALRLGAIPEGLEIRLDICVANVTFEDGTLTKILTADDFDEDGVCKYRLLQGADSTTSVCHTTHFYQDGVYLGSYWKK